MIPSLPALDPVRHDVTLLTDLDIYLFREGTHFRLYDKLGSRLMTVDGVQGVYFALWAPNANSVAVIGDFNGWDPHCHPLKRHDESSGIWEGFIPGVVHGMLYKYKIVSRNGGYTVDKRDPFAMFCEQPPQTASRVWDLAHQWHDQSWISSRPVTNSLKAPMAIYELHFGSWRRVPEENNRFLSYAEMAPRLVEYLQKTGFTHVEIMPLMEHPFYGSWGYQVTGYFSSTSRYGTPQDLMGLIDTLHRNGIGVILDWTPAHFPSDAHGLAYFDGTCLFEHADPRLRVHPEWKSYIFNYARNEVRSFLISNALFWMEKYHIDGLRVDGVASMLYLDYARRRGDWVPNRYGGRENIEAAAFLKRLNEEVGRSYPDVLTIAEDSTSWPNVTRPASDGGLGFSMKWNMGWMHDTSAFFRFDQHRRTHNFRQATSSLGYAFNEHYVLPISHDEVVYGKKSLLSKMPGSDYERFANLRLFLGLMYAYPGKKLLFMGCEFGQWAEWNHDKSLDWHHLNFAPHQGVLALVGDLNRLYRSCPACHERDFSRDGFEWLDCHETDRGVIVFLRKGDQPDNVVLVAVNFSNSLRRDFIVGVPAAGYWREMLNSDAKEYGGSGAGNCGGVLAQPRHYRGRPATLSLTIPPQSVIFFQPVQHPWGAGAPRGC